MTDENKKPQVAPEVSGDDLSEANGGFSLDTLYRYIHRGCGGSIEQEAIFGFQLSSWCCQSCGESHDRLEQFDYYSVLPKQPMF